MLRRSGKFYRKNEKEVMEDLGLKPTKNSGSGWIEKEDGQNDFIICQLKSTDKNSIKIEKLDLDKLLYNGVVAHKIPLFAIQFLQSQETFFVVRPEDIADINQYLKTGKTEKRQNYIDVYEIENLSKKNKKIIKSAKKAREIFYSEKEKKYKKEKKAK